MTDAAWRDEPDEPPPPEWPCESDAPDVAGDDRAQPRDDGLEAP